MVERIVEFCNILRRSGVRVSVSEDMDALRAVELLGLEDHDLFRAALRASLVKRSADFGTFEELFDLFFLGLVRPMREAERKIMAEMGLSPEEFDELLAEVRRFLSLLDGSLSGLSRALLSGDMGRVERMLRDAAEENLSGVGDVTEVRACFRRIAALVGLDKVERELGSFRSMVASSGIDAGTAEKIFRYTDRRLEDLIRMSRELARQSMNKNGSRALERERPDYLWLKNFAYYTEEDIRRMREVVALLARRLKRAVMLRRKRARRGRFDVKDTLRKNPQYGGVPFRIELDQRRKEKPQVVVLCDISDSVLNAARFMLQFVYSLQELYSRVRSFVFVSDIAEITGLFQAHEVHQAVDMALRGEVIDVNRRSDFGRAFEIFYRGYLSAVTAKTTFVILGDGRNNYNRPNEWVLGEIRRRAKRLVWLNPESRATWGTGDSKMPRYRRYCSVVEECRNLKQLTAVIDRITHEAALS